MSGLEGKPKIADETAQPHRAPVTQESGQVELGLPISHLEESNVVQDNSWSGGL